MKTTAENFTSWTRKAEEMSVTSLQLAIKDCGETAAMWDMADPAYAGRCRDEMSCYITALNDRLEAARAL